MDIMSKHTWMLFILVTFINAFIMRIRVKAHIELNPELKDGYNKLFKNFLIYGNILWIIAGIGEITGKTKSIFDFLCPGQFNPIVLLFHITVIALGIFGSYWIFLKNGGEFLSKHSNFFNYREPSKSVQLNNNKVKLFWTLGIIGSVVGEIMMWKTSMPVKKIAYFPNSQLVYDFSNRLPDLESIFIPLVFFVIGFGTYMYHKKYVNSTSSIGLRINKRKYGMVFGIISASFSGLISILLISAMFGEYFKTKSVYDNKQYQIIEGIVENFHPMPASGHDYERFTINGIEFKFSDFDESDFGYNNAASRGGVIKEGLKVRIGYFDNGNKNVILKLEIR